MTFGQRLVQLRKENGFKTRNELADKLKIPSTTLRNYETDVREPGHKFLKEISEFFNVSVDYLLCLTDEKEVLNSFRLKTAEYEHIKKYRNLDSHGQDLVDTVLLKEYDRCIKEPEEKCETVLKPSYQCGLSAGTGLYVFDDVPSEQIEVPIEFKDIDFVIGVNGDSMEPTYSNGEKVMIKKQEVQIGEIGAFMINGEAYIKERGKMGLISHNKKYPIKEFNDGMRIECIGKVVGKL
ncbi:XRE family transcriptional regulator [Candidatus Stoquefichus massiliensis]|uniref:XRE family transcriptional regulator n=1 Tax=Candidatus Stoquefichus massiliensis TaxID=1470350 RepID=UPI0004871D3A|nr:S24 family peptidase [Candidatus Stoquefichus massiliensis]